MICSSSGAVYRILSGPIRLSQQCRAGGEYCTAAHLVEQYKERTMRLRIWMLCGVLAWLFGLPGVAIAQVNDAPSLEGVIDLHAHVAPETTLLNFSRSLNAIEAAQIARIYGMRGMVFKEHHTETASWAYL